MSIASQYEALRQQVQFNCHLSDAHHGRNYSLCIYLLKMREFYRWEQGMGFGEPIPKGPLGEWLSEREQLWEQIEQEDYRDIELVGQALLPFDSDGVNQHLDHQGLLYSGGLCGSKPHFFLAELESTQQHRGIRVHLAGREWARELTAPPALSLNRHIYLRRESLQRMLWEKLEEWGWQEPDRAIARAVAHYDFTRDRDQALEQMAAQEMRVLLEHEVGEVLVGDALGPQWEALLSTLPHSHAELQLRAIRDHLVDCRYTLPMLLGESMDASLHFFIANLSGMRKALFPSLAAAYRAWLEGDGGKLMLEACKQGSEHWQQLAEQALDTFRDNGDEPKRLLQALGRSEQALAL